MPYYLAYSTIDWHYDEASAALKPVLAGAQTRLRPNSNHTDTTFEEVLREVAAANPAIVADALIEDGYRSHWLFRARNGMVEKLVVDERPEGALDRPIELPLDTIATVTLARDADEITELLEEQDFFDGSDDETVTLPLRFNDEAAMRDVLARVASAIDEPAEGFVADVDGQRFLIELAPGKATIRKLVIVTEPALVARLTSGTFTDAPVNPPRADEKREQSLYWPEPMLKWIQEQAARTDKSLSYIVQFAFKHARTAIAASDRAQLAKPVRAFDGEKRKQTLYFPGSMLVEMTEHATRLDTSLSLVAQSAVALARDAIIALPTASAFVDDEA
jgi:uncharacterized small protein (TIGR04563 family)